MFTDEDILSTADPRKCYRPALQVAYDRLMASPALEGTPEYAHLWKSYLAAGGDRTMLDMGIDHENWTRYLPTDADPGDALDLLPACKHPPTALTCWHADSPTGPVLCVACNCGAVLAGGAE